MVAARGGGVHACTRGTTPAAVGRPRLAYEVGASEEEPDTAFVVELWESEAAHRASLALPEVQAAIAAARPLLSGELGGYRFDVVGSPLRD